jgi:hypothetical protein
MVYKKGYTEAAIKEAAVKTMVNKRFLLGMLAMALVLGMTLAGCDDGSDMLSDTTWAEDDGFIYYFYSNGEAERISHTGVNGRYTYSVSGNTVTLTSVLFPDLVDKGVISGDTMTFTSASGEVTMTLHKN